MNLGSEPGPGSTSVANPDRARCCGGCRRLRTRLRVVPEPLCHRRYDVPLEARRERRSGAGVGHLLKPDAEVVLFEEVVFFLEWQTR
jgi:hypothetical protein